MYCKILHILHLLLIEPLLKNTKKHHSAFFLIVCDRTYFLEKLKKKLLLSKIFDHSKIVNFWIFETAR